MAQIRLVQGLGYGLAGLVMYKNSDGVGDYLNELGRASLHFWSRRPSESTDMSELNEKLDRLANRKGETVHIHPSGAGVYSGWFNTALGGTVLVAMVVHYTGLFDLSSMMYVTQSRFKTVTDALQEGVSTVNEALKKARIDLLAKIGVLETNLEKAKTELREQIVTSSDTVRDDVARVSGEVQGVNQIVTSLETKLNGIDGGVGDLRHAIDKANKGIHLLVQVVARAYGGGSDQGDNQVLEELNDYSELQLPSSHSSSRGLLEPGPLFKILSKDDVEGNADQGGGNSLSRSVQELIGGKLKL